MELSKFTKNELMNLVLRLQTEIERLQQNGSGSKKQQILTLLRACPHTISELAKILNTTPKVISSNLTYLRRENHLIATNPYQFKFLLTHDYPEDIDPLNYNGPKNPDPENS